MINHVSFLHLCVVNFSFFVEVTKAIVVSAMAGVTDTLVKLTQLAKTRTEYLSEVETLKEKVISLSFLFSSLRIYRFLFIFIFPTNVFVLNIISIRSPAPHLNFSVMAMLTLQRSLQMISPTLR